jgi:hypothetical protein
MSNTNNNNKIQFGNRWNKTEQEMKEDDQKNKRWRRRIGKTD